MNLQRLLAIQLSGVSQRHVANLVNGITGVGDKLTKKDFLFGGKEERMESERAFGGWVCFVVVAMPTRHVQTHTHTHTHTQTGRQNIPCWSRRC